MRFVCTHFLAITRVATVPTHSAIHIIQIYGGALEDESTVLFWARFRGRFSKREHGIYDLLVIYLFDACVGHLGRTAVTNERAIVYIDVHC